MNTTNYNYYLKRCFRKWWIWMIFLLHLIISIFRVFFIHGEPAVMNNTNDFFAYVFQNLVLDSFFLPWVTVNGIISWAFWNWIDDITQKTQKDGTDLFFLSTSIPVGRKKIFWGKVSFLTSFLSILYLITTALPNYLLWTKVDFLNGLTGSQKFFFLTCNFLLIPLFLIVPFIILLFSLASLDSVWYGIIKWFCRLSLIIYGGFLILVALVLRQGGESGEKIVEYGIDLYNWLTGNYLLISALIMGVVIILSLFTFTLAFNNFQDRDLN